MFADGGYVYMSGSSGIARTPTNRTTTPEVILNQPYFSATLAVREGFAYWLETGTLARIFACPGSGCAGKPRLVARNLGSSQNLAADDQYLYFTYAAYPGGSQNGAPVDQLLRCSISGCDEPTILVDGAGIGGPLAVDDSYVYFSGACSTTSEFREILRCSYVAVIAK
jgi:hypothetical protein